MCGSCSLARKGISMRYSKRDALNQGHDRIVVAIICAVVWTALCGTAFGGKAFDETPTSEMPSVTPEAGSQQAGASDESARIKQKQALQAATLLLVGITFVGVATIVILLLWGVRVRRLARRHLKPSSRVDEHWYLKGESSNSANESRQSSDPDLKTDETEEP
jgi:hypothetical protein